MKEQTILKEGRIVRKEEGKMEGRKEHIEGRREGKSMELGRKEERKTGRMKGTCMIKEGEKEGRKEGRSMEEGRKEGKRFFSPLKHSFLL